MTKNSNQNLHKYEVNEKSRSAPLCVDLDGSLLNTDTLFESMAIALRNWNFFKLMMWLIKGKAHFKERLSQEIMPDSKYLPYNRAVLKYIKEQKSLGRYLVLATGCNNKIAQSVSQHLGIFDEVIASDGKKNLRGATKAQALINRFGVQGFSYLGNDRVDLQVWKEALTGILVNTKDSVASQAERLVEIEARIFHSQNKLKSIFISLRPHHWIKNLLVFVPIILSNAFSDFYAWWQAWIVFLSLCATASAIYLINDIFDIEADRQHSSKRHRPIASGAISIKGAFILILAMLLIGLFLSAVTSTLLLVFIYAVTGIAYSAYLKKLPLVDIFTLAGFYTIRLFIGGVASGYLVSLWLLAHSVFLFLSLAIVKRITEIRKLPISTKENIGGRGYFRGDSNILQSMGVGSSFASAIVLALYVQSDVAAKTYSHPEILWGIVPMILLWQCRIWLSSSRGNMNEDPIVFAVKDRITWAIGILLVLIIIAANINLSF
jgi:4-hydroxybenzoate polyprenyltransferase